MLASPWGIRTPVTAVGEQGRALHGRMPLTKKDDIKKILLLRDERKDVGRLNDAEGAESSPYGVGDIARCQMALMLFDHASIGMTKLRRDHD
jgi:hypothetical protein